MKSDQLYLAPYSSPVTAREERKLILSVDDEVGVLFSRYKLLAAAGYAVLSASDGVQALGLFSTEKFDLVILDYNLPAMHGGLVAEAMKAHLPDVPVVMVSGADLPAEYRAFCDDCILKAAGPERLLHTIERILSPASSPDVERSQNAF